MPSPFPGMNPFLEQDDAWHDFHEKIIPMIAERLVVQVRPDYIVKIDEHIYSGLPDPPLDQEDKAWAESLIPRLQA
jgi:hypothetical protein